jgi:hypothetical protein
MTTEKRHIPVKTLRIFTPSSPHSEKVAIDIYAILSVADSVFDKDRSFKSTKTTIIVREPTGCANVEVEEDFDEVIRIIERRVQG